MSGSPPLVGKSMKVGGGPHLLRCYDGIWHTDYEQAVRLDRPTSFWRATGLQFVDIIGTATSATGNSTVYSTAIGRLPDRTAIRGTGSNLTIPTTPFSTMAQWPGLTLEAWVYIPTYTPPSSTKYTELINLGWVNDGANLYLSHATTGSMNAVGGIAKGNIQSNIVYVMSQRDQWVHLAMTFDRLTAIRKLYINGAVGASSTGSASDSASSTSPSAALMSGSVSERPPVSCDLPAVYPYALTQSQVLTHYRAGIGYINERPVLGDRPGDVLASDSFNRPDGTISGTLSDSAHGGKSAAWTGNGTQIVSNTAQYPGVTQTLTTMPLIMNDIYVHAQLSTLPYDDLPSIVARYVAPGAGGVSYDYIRVEVTATKNIQLRLYTGNNITNLATSTISVAGGDTIGLRCRGQLIEGLINDIVVCSAIDNTILTSQRVGFRLSASAANTPVPLDNFIVEKA